MKYELASTAWCNVCPQAKKLLDEYGIDYVIQDADTDVGQDFCVEYGIRSLPTLVVNGTTTGMYSGLQQIKNYLESSK